MGFLEAKRKPVSGEILMDDLAFISIIILALVSLMLWNLYDRRER